MVAGGRDCSPRNLSKQLDGFPKLTFRRGQGASKVGMTESQMSLYPRTLGRQVRGTRITFLRCFAEKIKTPPPGDAEIHIHSGNSKLRWPHRGQPSHPIATPHRCIEVKAWRKQTNLESPCLSVSPFPNPGGAGPGKGWARLLARWLPAARTSPVGKVQTTTLPGQAVLSCLPSPCHPPASTVAWQETVNQRETVPGARPPGSRLN